MDSKVKEKEVEVKVRVMSCEWFWKELPRHSSKMKLNARKNTFIA